MTSKIEENTSFARSYNRIQVASVASIKVGYRYQASNKQEPNNFGHQTMSGFKIDWYIKDQNGFRVSNPKAKQQKQTWEEATNVPAQRNEDFQKIVLLAASKLLHNEPNQNIINNAISTKIDSLKSKGLDRMKCENEQMLDGDFGQFIQALRKDHPVAGKDTNISQEDISTGIVLYMIGIHCHKETTKLGEFLLQLAKEESLPTFILATVNTLQSGQLTAFNKRGLGRIYQVLDDIFGFHLGRILLATSTLNQLKTIQDQDLPFFNQSDQSVQKCLSGVSCKAVFDPIGGRIC